MAGRASKSRPGPPLAQGLDPPPRRIKNWRQFVKFRGDHLSFLVK